MIYDVSLYSLRTLSNCLSPSPPPHPPYDSTISPFENNLSHVLKFFLHLCFLYFQSLPFSLFPSLFLSLSHYTQFLFPRLYGFFFKSLFIYLSGFFPISLPLFGFDTLSFPPPPPAHPPPPPPSLSLCLISPILLILISVFHQNIFLTLLLTFRLCPLNS